MQYDESRILPKDAGNVGGGAFASVLTAKELQWDGRSCGGRGGGE